MRIVTKNPLLRPSPYNFGQIMLFIGEQKRLKLIRRNFLRSSGQKLEIDLKTLLNECDHLLFSLLFRPWTCRPNGPLENCTPANLYLWASFCTFGIEKMRQCRGRRFFLGRCKLSSSRPRAKSLCFMRHLLRVLETRIRLRNLRFYSVPRSTLVLNCWATKNNE